MGGILFIIFFLIFFFFFLLLFFVFIVYCLLRLYNLHNSVAENAIKIYWKKERKNHSSTFFTKLKLYNCYYNLWSLKVFFVLLCSYSFCKFILEKCSFLPSLLTFLFWTIDYHVKTFFSENNSYVKKSHKFTFTQKLSRKHSLKSFKSEERYKSLFNKTCNFRPATLLKKRLWHMCFPVSFTKFLRTPFFIEHLRWLLL